MISSVFRKLTLTTLALALATSSASAALLLTVDSVNQTLTWSGTFTSESLPSSPGQSFHYRIGFSSWVGGVSGGEAGLLATSTNYDFLPDTNAKIVVNSSQNSLYADIGWFNNYIDLSPIAVTVTGNENTFSYSDLPQEHRSFIASLDGQELSLQRFRGITEIFDLEVAGTIAVVPEPSTVAFLAGGLSILFVVTRRIRETT